LSSCTVFFKLVDGGGPLEGEATDFPPHYHPLGPMRCSLRIGPPCFDMISVAVFCAVAGILRSYFTSAGSLCSECTLCHKVHMLVEYSLSTPLFTPRSFIALTPSLSIWEGCNFSVPSERVPTLILCVWLYPPLLTLIAEFLF